MEGEACLAWLQSGAAADVADARTLFVVSDETFARIGLSQTADPRRFVSYHACAERHAHLVHGDSVVTLSGVRHAVVLTRDGIAVSTSALVADGRDRQGLRVYVLRDPFPSIALRLAPREGGVYPAFDTTVQGVFRRESVATVSIATAAVRVPLARSVVAPAEGVQRMMLNVDDVVREALPGSADGLEYTVQLFRDARAVSSVRVAAA